MPTIHINSFVRRQTKYSPFSYWTQNDTELLALIQANFAQAQGGYRDGVLLVPLPPAGFFSGVVEVQSGTVLIGQYAPRREGEEPRTSIYALGDKAPARSVCAILYRHDVLAEGNDDESDCDFELISVNASPTEEEAPILPGTLMANYFVDDGGTNTGMTPLEFVEALRVSRIYWKNRFLVAPDKLQADVAAVLHFRAIDSVDPDKQ